MRSDLSSLIIQDKEIANLIGVKLRVFKPKRIDNFNQDSVGLFIFLLPMVYLCYFDVVGYATCLTKARITFLIPFDIASRCNAYNSLPVIMKWIRLFMILMLLGSTIYLIYSLFQDTHIYFKLTRERHLKGILKEIKQYNELIKAICINDQLEYANNRPTNITDREKIIEALKLTRLDLIGALKIEKILWENKGFIQQNPTMFVNSLEALESLKMRDKASEYGQFLNGALDVAINTQKVVERLQNKR